MKFLCQHGSLCFAKVLVLIVAFWTPALWAEQHGLIVGVSEFRHHPQLGLPGVSRDVELMAEVYERMGIAKENTVTLVDHLATYEAVKNALTELSRTRSEDTVVIYVSTHGSQIADDNGDETKDGYDEFLALNDLLIERRHDAELPVDGYLLDDELSELLSAIPARKLVIIDACASATAHKSLQMFRKSFEVISKYLRGHWSGGAALEAGSSAELLDLNGSDTVVLSASQDAQLAGSDSAGSVFTKALYNSFTLRPFTPFCWYLKAFGVTTKSSRNSQQPGLDGSWRLANIVWGGDLQASIEKALENFHSCLTGKIPTTLAVSRIASGQLEVELDKYDQLQAYSIASDSMHTPHSLAVQETGPVNTLTRFLISGINEQSSGLLLLAYRSQSSPLTPLLSDNKRWALDIARLGEDLEVSGYRLQPAHDSLQLKGKP